MSILQSTLLRHQRYCHPWVNLS